MVSVLDLMILCLDVDSVEDLANFGSAEANPADSSIYVLSIPWKSNFLLKGVVVDDFGLTSADSVTSLPHGEHRPTIGSS